MAVRQKLRKWLNSSNFDDASSWLEAVTVKGEMKNGSAQQAVLSLWGVLQSVLRVMQFYDCIIKKLV